MSSQAHPIDPSLQQNQVESQAGHENSNNNEDPDDLPLLDSPYSRSRFGSGTDPQLESPPQTPTSAPSPSPPPQPHFPQTGEKRKKGSKLSGPRKTPNWEHGERIALVRAAKKLQASITLGERAKGERKTEQNKELKAKFDEEMGEEIEKVERTVDSCANQLSTLKTSYKVIHDWNRRHATGNQTFFELSEANKKEVFKMPSKKGQTKGPVISQELYEEIGCYMQDSATVHPLAILDSSGPSVTHSAAAHFASAGMSQSADINHTEPTRNNDPHDSGAPNKRRKKAATSKMSPFQQSLTEEFGTCVDLLKKQNDQNDQFLNLFGDFVHQNQN